MPLIYSYVYNSTNWQRKVFYIIKKYTQKLNLRKMDQVMAPVRIFYFSFLRFFMFGKKCAFDTGTIDS